MSNRIIDNILSESEIEEFKRLIDLEISLREELTWDDNLEGNKPVILEHYVIDRRMGRLFVENLPTVPESVIEKINKIAKDFDTNAKYIGATYCEYSSKYGKPGLSMHKDSGSQNHICLDYQLESNVTWPLIIEEEEFSHNDNQIVIFKTTQELHGRPPQKFFEGQFVKVIFFYFDCKAE